MRFCSASLTTGMQPAASISCGTSETLVADSDEPGDAAVVERVELLRGADAVVRRRERQPLGLPAVEVDVDLGVALGEQVERHDRELVGPARRLGRE